MGKTDWAKKAKEEFDAMPVKYQLDWEELRRVVSKRHQKPDKIKSRLARAAFLVLLNKFDMRNII